MIWYKNVYSISFNINQILFNQFRTCELKVSKYLSFDAFGKDRK